MDRSAEFLGPLGRIRDRCRQAQGPLLEWHLLSDERPDTAVALLLLEMLQDADDLLQLVCPDPHPGEILGFPPEMIGGRPHAIRVGHDDHAD